GAWMHSASNNRHSPDARCEATTGAGAQRIYEMAFRTSAERLPGKIVRPLERHGFPSVDACISQARAHRRIRPASRLRAADERRGVYHRASLAKADERPLQRQ